MKNNHFIDAIHYNAAAGPADLTAIGVPEARAEHVIAVGFTNVENLRKEKPSAVHQKLNGFRKKNKLDVPTLQLDEVEAWMV